MNMGRSGEEEWTGNQRHHLGTGRNPRNQTAMRKGIRAHQNWDARRKIRDIGYESNHPMLDLAWLTKSHIVPAHWEGVSHDAWTTRGSKCRLTSIPHVISKHTDH